MMSLAIALLGISPAALQSASSAPTPRLPDPPIRARTVLMVGDRAESIALGRLEPGRGYRVRIALLSQSSPAEGRVEARVEGGGAIWTESADRQVVHVGGGFAPESTGPVRLVLGGVGEMGSSYRVRVEWQAEAEPRMSLVDYVPSPNQNSRTPAASVTAIVVHATVTPTTEATVSWFLTPKSQVSAHYVVGRDGKIVQMVDDTTRAWHAGVSELEGVKGVNDFSVGIEIVNLNDGKDPFTDAQYEAVAAIIRHIRDQYDVPDSRIVSHEFVARPPGRKNDPKGFDFPRLLRLSRNPR